MELLVCDSLSKHFGGLKAVDQVSFAVHQGQICSIIGPNGAGKTTIFNLLTGFLPPTSGDACYEGKSIVGLPPHRVAQLGITRTYQRTSVFPGLTVLENTRIGNHRKQTGTALDSSLHTARWKRDEKSSTEKAFEVLDFLGLIGAGNKIARNLPYGQLRLLEIAIALSLEPRLLLLDEPAAGMNPDETQRLMALIRQLRDRGTTILLVEHNMQLVMGISDHVLVLDHGLKIAAGTPDQVSCDERVIEAYLGKGFLNAKVKPN